MENIYGKAGVVLPEQLIIPEIDDEKLKHLYNVLKLIVTIDEMKYLLREFSLSELRNLSYIWNRNEDKREVVNSNKLETLDEFLCLHAWSYDGLFKPSIAEVLSQMPEELTREANAFEIVESPKTEEDIFRYKEVVDNGYHLSKVRAYRIHR